MENTAENETDGYPYKMRRTRKDKKHPNKREKPLPSSLARLTYKDIFRFRIIQETIVDPLSIDKKTGKSQATSDHVSPIDMAVELVVTEKTGRFQYGAGGTIKPLFHKTSYRLEDFTRTQLYKLARNMGLKNISHTTKEYVRRAFAIRYRAYERYVDANPDLKLKRFEDYSWNVGKEIEASDLDEEDLALGNRREEHKRLLHRRNKPDNYAIGFSMFGDIGIFDRPMKRLRKDPFDPAPLPNDEEDCDWENEKSDEEDEIINTSTAIGSSDSSKDATENGLHSHPGLGYECEEDSTYHKMLLVQAFVNADKTTQRILQMAEVSKALLAQARDLEELDSPPDIVQRIRNHADYALRTVLSMPTVTNPWRD